MAKIELLKRQRTDARWAVKLPLRCPTARILRTRGGGGVRYFQQAAQRGLLEVPLVRSTLRAI